MKGQEINLPWIFRLAPDDRLRAEAFARAIYPHRGYRRVVLVFESTHDGRLGAREFEKASSKWGAPTPDRVELDPASFDLPKTLAEIQSRLAGAIVLWTGPAVASEIVPRLQQGEDAQAAFLCQKAAVAVTGTRSGNRVWTLGRSQLFHEASFWRRTVMHIVSRGFRPPRARRIFPRWFAATPQTSASADRFAGTAQSPRVG